MMESLGFLAVLAIPVALCTWTITQTEIFRRVREGMQNWAKRYPDPKTGSPLAGPALLAYLPTCYYCTSHYVGEAFMVLAWLGGSPLSLLKLGYTSLWGLVIASFTLIAIANLYLTGFNLFRVVLRNVQALADFNEARRDVARALNKIGEPIIEDNDVILQPGPVNRHRLRVFNGSN
ncbi:MAG: hypothetical protein HC904_16270 [Blastochloris sp.]|nr:hypothetical protein [Blastochloris sp.]